MILYGADLRLHYCFVVKSGVFYPPYALACFSNQYDCHFSIRSFTELVNCGLLSELGVLEWPVEGSVLYALACFPNQYDCHFSIRSFTELVNCGLLSELGVECLNGLWQDL